LFRRSSALSVPIAVTQNSKNPHCLFVRSSFPFLIMTTTPTTTKSTTMTWLLTGDIGGTNSRMGIYDTVSTADQPLYTKTFRNQDFLTEAIPGIFETKIIAPFLKEAWDHCNNTATTSASSSSSSLEDLVIVACLAIAGPVRNNAVSMSNLHDIVIDGTAIARGTYNVTTTTTSQMDPFLQKIKTCKIINDFVAQGYGCLTLQPHEVRELRPNPDIPFATMDPLGPKVCVGAGTGLGECFLTPSGSGGDDGLYECYPSEGGHVEYAPRSDLEIKLWNYLLRKFEYRHRVSVERVVSGRGLANCYEFLALEFPDQVDDSIHQAFLEAGDLQGKVVADHARGDQRNALCSQAMEIMMRYVFIYLCIYIRRTRHVCVFRRHSLWCVVGSWQGVQGLKKRELVNLFFRKLPPRRS
jgi:glucokinase